jgi:hypothetical protein
LVEKLVDQTVPKMVAKKAVQMVYYLAAQSVVQ